MHGNEFRHQKVIYFIIAENENVVCVLARAWRFSIIFIWFSRTSILWRFPHHRCFPEANCKFYPGSITRHIMRLFYGVHVFTDERQWKYYKHVHIFHLFCVSIRVWIFIASLTFNASNIVIVIVIDFHNIIAEKKFAEVW